MPDTRSDHVAWCKERALAELEHGAGPVETRISHALASLGSDLHKHPETDGHAAIELGLMLALTGNLQTEQQMREWIEGVQ